MSFEPAPVAPPKSRSRRSCLGCLGSGALGCLAFLVGGFFAAALLAPSLLGGFTKRQIEDQFAGRYAGTLTVGALDLEWRGNQCLREVELTGPEGGPVLTGTVTTPGMLDLVLEDTTEAEFVVELDALTVEVDQDGRSNLRRALTRRKSESGGAQIAELDEWVKRYYHFRVRGRVAEGRYHDRRLEAGRILRVQGLLLDVRYLAGRLVELQVSGRAGASEGELGSFELDWRLGREGQPGVTAFLDCQGVPVAALQALLDDGGLLPEFLGASLDLRLDLSGDPYKTATLTGALDSSVSQVNLTTQLQEGRLVGEPQWLSADLPLPAAALEEPLTARWPEGVALARPAPGLWSLESGELNAPLPIIGDEVSTLAEALDAALLTWTLRGNEACALSDAETGDSLLDLSSPQLGLELRPGATPQVTVLAGAADARVSLTLSSFDGPEQYAYALDAGAFPMALLDRLLQLDGLLAASLGASHPLRVRHDRLDPAAWVQLELLDPEGGVRIACELRDGLARLGADGPLELSLPYCEPVQRKVLAPLLPWLRELEGKQLDVFCEELVVPLPGGDLNSLSGRVELRPGLVQGRVHEGFYRAFPTDGEGDEGTFETQLLPVAVELAGAEAHYDALELPLAGDTVEFSGSLDLASGEVDLAGEVQLAQVAGLIGIHAELRPALRGVPYPVDLSVAGTWDAPELRLPVEFMREFNENGLQRIMRQVPGFEALETGLQQLFSSGDDGDDDER